MEFEVGDRVMLKSHLGKGLYDSVSGKCYADEPLVMPLEGIHVDDKLQFVEELIEIMEWEIKRLKRSQIPLVKVRWNSRRGPEFTWEREDSFKQKYPQLFTNRASSSTTRKTNGPTLGDYSKPSHEGYRNTIELPVGNNVVPLRSDTIRLVQNGCSFHGLRSEDPNQHLKDFLKLVDSLDLDGENRERTRLRLFQFSLRDQASNWLERLPAGSITTWEDLTTRFLAQFFPPGRTAKLRNDILMFQQHHGESLSEAWTRFKDLLQKVPHHGIDLWL
ncbi:zinc finger, CCHC-type containing protein [Tanacetum coccineum]